MQEGRETTVDVLQTLFSSRSIGEMGPPDAARSDARRTRFGAIQQGLMNCPLRDRRAITKRGLRVW